MAETNLERGKRFLSVLIGIGLIYISILFSNRGFNFENKDPQLEWIGIFLAIAITVIELVFNGQLFYPKKNMTIYWIGILAYTYGILTNVIGYWDAQGLVINKFADVLTIRGIFGILIGVFFEVVAEPLIVFGLIGVSDKQGDMIGALLNNFDRVVKPEQKKQSGQLPNNNNKNNNPYRENYPNNRQPQYQNQRPPAQQPIMLSKGKHDGNRPMPRPEGSRKMNDIERGRIYGDNRNNDGFRPERYDEYGGDD